MCPLNSPHIGLIKIFTDRLYQQQHTPVTRLKLVLISTRALTITRSRRYHVTKYGHAFTIRGMLDFPGGKRSQTSPTGRQNRSTGNRAVLSASSDGWTQDSWIQRLEAVTSCRVDDDELATKRHKSAAVMHSHVVVHSTKYTPSRLVYNYSVLLSTTDYSCVFNSFHFF